MSQPVLATEFIELMENRGLLDADLLSKLRAQVQRKGDRVPAEKIAKALISKGHLSAAQAKEIISELQSRVTDEIVEVETIDEVMEVVPVEDEVMEVEALDDDIMEVEPVDDLQEAQSGEEDVVEVEAIEVEPIAEALPVSGRQRPSGTASSRRASSPASSERRRRKQEAEDEKNVWDSFKIYGVGGAILACLVLGWFFYNYINKGSAADTMERANGFYAQQNFNGALQGYRDYLDWFGEETEDSSTARVRIVMSQLYQTRQNSSDPSKFLEQANRLLPAVSDEPAMNDNRADLAGLLVEVAEDFIRRAERTLIADEKETLVGQLDEHMKLVDEPQYVSSELRDALGKRLGFIQEDRMRVIRDISRDRKLAEAIAKMRATIDAKDTKTAYDTRKAITNEYPRLRDEQQMLDLIAEASQLQQELVKTSVTELDYSTDELETQIRKSIVLANRKGRAISGLNDLVYYVRVGGSVVALQPSDGALLWRRFIGYRDAHPPVALGEASEDGVLLSDGPQEEVQSLSGADGKLRWRASIGESFTKPVVAGDTVNLSTHSGKVISLDALSGETRWVSQIPQTLEVSPGIASKRLPVAYLPGAHSNLYVLNHRDGSCEQSFYLGHEEQTVRTPPVHLMGHLFVFENRAEDYCMMHILETDDDGMNLRAAQNEVRLEGNVLVDPLIAERRLVVVTNLGEVSVFEVEPTAETDKVTMVARQVSSYNEPTLTQIAIDRAQMWVAGRNIMRYELQFNTGRVIPGKVEYEGDVFTTRPQLIGDTLIHARVVRGTEGIRVTAVEPKTMQVQWETDLGVPTALVAQADRVLHAVTSQGALYELDRASIASGATKKPIENPGGSGHGIRLDSPIPIDGPRRLMVNQTKPGQIAVYDPTRERQKLRLVILALPEGRPVADPLVVGGLLMPLDSGRVAFMDWQSGRMITNPFQPSLKPGEKVQWTSMVSLPSDREQVIFGDNRKKLYRIRAGERIRLLSEEPVERVLAGPMTIVGDKLLAIAKGPSADMLNVFDTNSLKREAEKLLDGVVVYGPKVIGPLAIVVTDNQKLVAFDDAGDRVWQIDIPAGVPVGEPLLDGGSVTLAGDQGWVIGFDAASGKSNGRSDIGQPLSGTPLAIGNTVLVPGSEGIVFAIDPLKAP